MDYAQMAWMPTWNVFLRPKLGHFKKYNYSNYIIDLQSTLLFYHQKKNLVAFFSHFGGIVGGQFIILKTGKEQVAFNSIFPQVLCPGVSKNLKLMRRPHCSSIPVNT